ncbi:MAG: hypothetical protein KA118_00925 [Verrucomicrobia bacterium]|nr:hypothetical protein [Verrucomicrobiota bacterium]
MQTITIRGLRQRRPSWALLILLAATAAIQCGGAELHIGAACTDITPERPVALDGQFNTRISTNIDNPLLATAVAIEAREGGQSVDEAIFLSADIVAFRGAVPPLVRRQLSAKLPAFDPRKLILTATHTHTGPVTEEGKYEIPTEGVTQPAEYVESLAGKLAEVAARAWDQRQPGGVSWGLGHAVIGHNRRAVYADGTAKMYGSTRQPDFRGIEGGEDHGLELLFFWNRQRKLIASGINVPCPSQVVEHRSTVNADFWHDVRAQLRAGIARDLCVLGWPGAAGDLSPHWLYRKAAEERMLRLRGLTRTQDIGRRISIEVIQIAELTRDDIRTEAPFGHHVVDLALPVRKVTEEEAAVARKEIEALKAKNDTSRRIAWYQATIDRFQTQETALTHTAEVHVLRIGDIAIATCPFELFQDYGIQIKSRSKADQTFVIQLTGGSGRYLPTRRAVAGGGYSAVVESGIVGPDGGQVLVDRIVELIDRLWDSPEPHQSTTPGQGAGPT